MYDIIGDIHGHGDKLVSLLEKMGYKNTGTCYQHPSRKVIFVGDFIDRGTTHKQVMNIVMPMVEQGSALAVMGNHEFNALAYHTKHPETGEWLRPHSDKNTEQHQEFLDEYGAPEMTQERTEVLDFFFSLPLWLDLGEIRIIHACWQDSVITSLNSRLTHQRLQPSDLVEATTPGTSLYDAIEISLKGMEQRLPNGISFRDSKNHPRYDIRVKWWLNTPKHFGDIAMGNVHLTEETRNLPLPTGYKAGYCDSAPPVFFGHYWFTGTPSPVSHNAACVDYSAARAQERLTAYRWSGERVLVADNFIQSD